jgi:hypothetical protein
MRLTLDSHSLSGRYDREVAEMLIYAFKHGVVVREDKKYCPSEKVGSLDSYMHRERRGRYDNKNIPGYPCHDRHSDTV